MFGKIFFCIVGLLALSSKSFASVTPDKNLFALEFKGKISNSSRTEDTWLSFSSLSAKFGNVYTVKSNNFLIELIPSKFNSENTILTYKILKYNLAKNIVIGMGNIMLTNGHSTHLMQNSKDSQELFSFFIRVNSESDKATYLESKPKKNKKSKA